MAGGSRSAMRTAQEEDEQETSCDVKRDGQSLREAAVTRGQAVHRMRRQTWVVDDEKNGKSGPTAGNRADPLSVNERNYSW